MLCSLLADYRFSEEMRCLHFQGRSISKALKNLVWVYEDGQPGYKPLVSQSNGKEKNFFPLTLKGPFFFNQSIKVGRKCFLVICMWYRDLRKGGIRKAKLFPRLA
jgi:hypothetical protein